MEQTRFLSTVFLCILFKLENIYSGVNFCGKNVCVNLYLRELVFADRWKNRKNRKNFVPHSSLDHVYISSQPFLGSSRNAPPFTTATKETAVYTAGELSVK